MYLEATMRPPARRDFLSFQPSNPELDAFYRQSLIAKAWPVPDDIASRNLFQSAIESVVSGISTPDQAINNLGQRLTILLPK